MVTILAMADLVLDALPAQDPMRDEVRDIKREGLRAAATALDLARRSRELSPMQFLDS